jgi:hypothetical protein
VTRRRTSSWFWQLLPDGNLKIFDWDRGIALIVEPISPPRCGRLWIVVATFRRIDNGGVSEPQKVEYGLN